MCAKRILVAPLGWGLGHATRCIPLVEELLRAGAEPWLASDGRALHLLRREFPDLPLLELPSYPIRYFSDHMVLNVATRSHGLLAAIWRENRLVQRWVREHRFDALLSDNRFGCFAPGLPSIFLTHQLFIRTPWQALDWAVRQLNHRFIRQFSECWVPDYPDLPNLSGRLSHGDTRLPHSFIGPLSRMQTLERPQRYDVAVVLSGPEPQRTRLEQTLLRQASTLPLRWLFVQGLTEERQQWRRQDQIDLCNFMSSGELNEALAASRIVVCRSGYSSIMDLAVLGKKAVLIPTPGQTEQEYLAQRLYRHKLFYTQSQAQLDLSRALVEVERYPGFSQLELGRGLLKEKVRQLAD